MQAVFFVTGVPLQVELGMLGGLVLLPTLVGAEALLALWCPAANLHRSYFLFLSLN